jgi:hypothetical protein
LTKDHHGLFFVDCLCSGILVSVGFSQPFWHFTLHIEVTRCVSALWNKMGDQENAAVLPALPFSKLKDGALLQCLVILRSNHSLDDVERRPLCEQVEYPRPRYTRAREWLAILYLDDSLIMVDFSGNYLRGIVLRKLRLGVKSQFPVVAPTLSHKLLSLPFELCFEVCILSLSPT